MKKGYRIEIQSDLDEYQQELAKKKADWFIEQVTKNNGQWNHLTRGGHPNGLPLQRGVFGYSIRGERNSSEVNYTELVFRRISRNRRIFGIVTPDRLRTKQGEKVNLNQCICKRHLGGERVDMLETDTYIYHEEGEIKG